VGKARSIGILPASQSAARIVAPLGGVPNKGVGRNRSDLTSSFWQGVPEYSARDGNTVGDLDHSVSGTGPSKDAIRGSS